MRRPLLLGLAIIAVFSFGATGCGQYGECQPYLIHPNSAENPFPDSLGYCLLMGPWVVPGPGDTGWWFTRTTNQFFAVSGECEDSPMFDWHGPTGCPTWYPGPRGPDPNQIERAFGSGPTDAAEAMEQAEPVAIDSPELRAQLRRYGIDPLVFEQRMAAAR